MGMGRSATVEAPPPPPPPAPPPPPTGMVEAKTTTGRKPTQKNRRNQLTIKTPQDKKKSNTGVNTQSKSGINM